MDAETIQSMSRQPSRREVVGRTPADAGHADEILVLAARHIRLRPTTDSHSAPYGPSGRHSLSYAPPDSSGGSERTH